MDARVLAAAALGCSIGLMFSTIVDAVDSHYKMKLMLKSTIEHAKNESTEKKTQK